MQYNYEILLTEYTILRRWGTFTFMSTSICAIYFNINIDCKARLVRLYSHEGLNYFLVKICNKQAASVGDESQSSTTEISGATMITQESDPDQNPYENCWRKTGKACILFLLLSEIPRSTVITIKWKSSVAKVPEDWYQKYQQGPININIILTKDSKHN